MAAFTKQGDKFLYDGLILEAKESITCAGCFFLYDAESVCTLRDGALPSCTNLDHNKDIIYKYIRPATDEEIRKGVVDV